MGSFHTFLLFSLIYSTSGQANSTFDESQEINTTELAGTCTIPGFSCVAEENFGVDRYCPWETNRKGWTVAVPSPYWENLLNEVKKLKCKVGNFQGGVDGWCCPTFKQACLYFPTGQIISSDQCGMSRSSDKLGMCTKNNACNFIDYWATTPECTEPMKSKCNFQTHLCEPCTDMTEPSADCSHIRGGQHYCKTTSKQIKMCAECTKNSHCQGDWGCYGGKCGQSLSCTGYFYGNNAGSNNIPGPELFVQFNGQVAHLHMSNTLAFVSVNYPYPRPGGHVNDIDTVRRWQGIADACRHAVEDTQYETKTWTWDVGKTTSFFKPTQGPLSTAYTDALP